MAPALSQRSQDWFGYSRDGSGYVGRACPSKCYHILGFNGKYLDPLWQRLTQMTPYLHAGGQIHIGGRCAMLGGRCRGQSPRVSSPPVIKLPLWMRPEAAFFLGRVIGA
jgi:hypothetical protein